MYSHGKIAKAHEMTKQGAEQQVQYDFIGEKRSV